jgi:cathepsin B
MKTLILIAILAISHCHIQQPYITKELVSEVSESASFETYDFEEHPFKNYSEADIKSLLGTIVPSSTPTTVDLGAQDCDVPESFDGRVQWPGYVHKIRNQASCGSCWAFAASEVLSDRFSIATKGEVNVVLSPQDLVSCDRTDMGCNGGYLDKSWDYIKTYGIVSDDCLPYTSGNGSSGTCPNDITNNKCPNGKPFHKYHVTGYTHFSNNCEIKKSLMTEGPTETGFMVYNDFMSYRSGVYTSNCRSMLGGHAVKIVGWGVENNVEYWIVANSWTSSWGEKGFVRVATGQSCLNFDTQMYAGHVDVNRLFKETFQ